MVEIKYKFEDADGWWYSFHKVNEAIPYISLENNVLNDKYSLLKIKIEDIDDLIKALTRMKNEED